MEYQVLAIDPGYSNLKIGFSAGKALVPQTLVLPAGVGPAATFSERVNGIDPARLDAIGVRVQVNGKDLIAGVDQTYLKVKRQRNPQYPFTDEYLALIYASFIKADATEIDTLVVGLPVEQYLDSVFRERVAARLRGVHRVSPDREVVVHFVVITAQPIGGYVDACFQATQDIDRRIMQHGRVCVLDPGFYSVDWAIIDQSRVRKSASGSNSCAMSVVVESAARSIEQEHEDKVNIERIEQALRTSQRTILFHGNELDLAPYLKNALLAANEDTATDLLNARNLDREQIDLVVLVGGGAEYYRHAAEKAFPGARVVIPPRPVVSNVRGFWYMEYARHLVNSTRARAE